MNNFDPKKLPEKPKTIKIPVNLEGIKSLGLKAKEVYHKDKKKAIIIMLVLAVALVVVARISGNVGKAIFKPKEPTKKTASITAQDEATPVKVYQVKKMDFKDTLPAMGNIKGYREINMSFQVAGVIESYNFEEGEKIQEGDIVASLIQRDALLKLKYSEVELKKTQKLYEIGAIGPTKLEQAKLEYESAKSDLDKTNIYAMSNGYLGSKLKDVGSYVNPSMTEDNIGVFVQIDKVFAEFNIIEKDVPKIAIGQKVEVFADAFPTKSFQGAIDRISPIVEGRSRTEMAKVELDNKDEILKPGMFVRALIATYEKKDALVVPASAVKKKDKEAEYIVYVVHKEDATALDEKKTEEKPKKFLGLFPMKKKEAPKKEETGPAGPPEKPAEFGTIEVRKVKPGYITQDAFEIEDGLKEDELIVSEIQEDFKDKARVEIAEVQEGLV
jgi:membrane fusion protein (multidrug efflux system)